MSLCSDIFVNSLYVSSTLPLFSSFAHIGNASELHFDLRILCLVDLVTNELYSTLIHTCRSHHNQRKLCI